MRLRIVARFDSDDHDDDDDDDDLYASRNKFNDPTIPTRTKRATITTTLE